MSEPKSKKLPNRLLAYKPVASPKAKRGPIRLNTKGKAPSGRNVGRLADLLKMPLDVFCEIASYLHPSDILQLARVSLRVRAVLMSRSSAHVWITARRVIGMPECPPDLSEPQYASLVFEHTCFACGASRAMKHSAQLRVRFCGNCWKENVKTNREFWSTFVPNKWNKDFSLELLPSADDVYYIVGRSLRCSFYKPELDAVLKRYVELKKANRQDALSAYRKERKEFVRQSFEFGRDVDTWWVRYSAGLRAEKEKIQEHKDEDKMERKHIVHAKLIAAGYSAADFPFCDPEWDKIVTKRVKLTDKYWNSNMLPKLKEMIEALQARKEQLRRELRHHRRTIEFAKIYLSRGVSANKPDEGPFMMPSWRIFEDDPQVQALLTEDDCNIPFTEDRYEQIEDVIAESVIKYNIHARRDLARLHGLFLLPGESEEETDENVIKPFLAKATIVFHVAWSPNYKCMSYETLTRILHLTLLCFNPERTEPPTWNNVLLGIIPDVLAGKIARELLRVAGAPENSTWEQMERSCGEKLVCTCRKPHFEQPVGVANLIQHIRDERTWNKSEVERWRDEGLEDGSDFPIDHAVSEIHNFVKVLPEGVTLDAFMDSQPPPLGGTVGNLARVRNPFFTFAHFLGFAPPLEERRFVCEHCGDGMIKEYLVWHMNTKHKKRAHPNDVLTWTFPPGMLDLALTSDDDYDDDYDDESDFEDDIDMFVSSVVGVVRETL